MAATQLTASPVTVSARSLASLEGFRASSVKFSSLKPGTLRQSQFRRFVVKAASVVAPKYTSIKPLGDRVLVKIKEAEEKTMGGILLPSTAQSKPQGGEVVAVGEGRTIGKTKIDITVPTGAQIIYSKYAGTEVEFNDVKHLILKEDDIVGILETEDIKDLKPLNDRVFIKISRDKVCCFGRISNTMASFSTSLHAVPNGKYMGETRRTGVQWCNRSLRWDPYKFHDKKSHRLSKIARIITVRSDLSGAATPESFCPEPEIKLSSRLRGICFCVVAAISAIFLIVLMIIGHPFVLLFDRHRRKFHHFIAKIWASISIYPFYKIEIEGLENLPSSDTPAVYVSNHQSFLDIYTLLSLGKSFKFISKTGIFVIPIIGWAMFMMGVVPLKRMDPRSQLDCLKRCMELLKKGASVFFFPEGTRSKDGRLGPFKKGAFTVAAKTGVPVVPITLMGTGKIMPTGSEGILNHGNVRVIIHKPIHGSKADVLCNEARSKIAESMDLLS